MYDGEIFFKRTDTSGFVIEKQGTHKAVALHYYCDKEINPYPANVENMVSC